jgi:hypothetical protein
MGEWVLICKDKKIIAGRRGVKEIRRQGDKETRRQGDIGFTDYQGSVF